MKYESDTNLHDKRLLINPGVINFPSVKNKSKGKIIENDENFYFDESKKSFINKNFSKIEPKFSKKLLIKIKLSEPSSSNSNINNISNNTFSTSRDKILHISSSERM